MDKGKEDLFRDRMKVCKQCPALEVVLLKGRFCKLCGCNLSVKGRLHEQECPLGKWKE